SRSAVHAGCDAYCFCGSVAGIFSLRRLGSAAPVTLTRSLSTDENGSIYFQLSNDRPLFHLGIVRQHLWLGFDLHQSLRLYHSNCGLSGTVPNLLSTVVLVSG